MVIISMKLGKINNFKKILICKDGKEENKYKLYLYLYSIYNVIKRSLV